MTALKRIVVLSIVCLTGVTAAVAAGQRPSRLSDEQLTVLLGSIETRAGNFRESLQVALDRSPLDGTDAESQYKQTAEDLQLAARQLRDRVTSGRSSPADVEDVLSRAAVIDQIMARNRLDASVQRDWKTLRSAIDAVAQGSGFTANWVAASTSKPRMSDKAVSVLMKSIEASAKRFRGSLEKSLGKRRDSDPAARTAIRQSAEDFAAAAKQLRKRFANDQLATGDVEDVMRRAGYLDHFVSSQQERLSEQAVNDWVRVRGDLDRLAQAYNIVWIWGGPSILPGEPRAHIDQARVPRALLG